MLIPRRFLLLLLAASLPWFARAERTVVDLSGPGWHLWLDRSATWKNDPLFLPPVDLAKLPVNPPTGGWDQLQFAHKEVSVPGTVEEYLHPGNGPEGDITGVSWWWRTIRIPETKGRVVLQFESQRHRAEVFVNHQLVGYDVVGGTPFEVDLTGKVKPGEECQLAVRITDPGGNFDWRDSSTFSWGDYKLPLSHGFGGITGPVKLVVTDPVFLDDVYVQNQSEAATVKVFATVKNATGREAVRDVHFLITDLRQPGSEKMPPVMFGKEFNSVKLVPGDNVVSCLADVPNAKLWNLEHPNLYVCNVQLSDDGKATDTASQIFGFRWFAPEGVGSNAVFRLNGQRVVLRTAISWGFWPINGIFPTPQLAEKQVRIAKELGLNMLNFHRAIGQPLVLNKADELGLLYYEEPGAYKTATEPFADALMREKVRRMIKRDRSHPSLVIYNLINERSPDEPLQSRERRDLLAAHRLDPSRTITLSSSWAKRADQPEDIKAHMRPFDDELHFTGWFDNHHAGGPEVWRQSLYQSPERYYNRTTNRKEIVYWGEEGAISSPPRLQKIKAALDASPTPGWDGETYLEWYRQFDDFLTRKHLRSAFPDVDALTTAMGVVSLYHQGRKIEQMRLNDVTDGYAINGWEAESIENHSGIVDCWRNPKGDPSILAYYNQPLYVAVKPRSSFAQIPGAVAVDFYAINEKNIHGAHQLKIAVRNPDGLVEFAREIPVTLAGGDVFGEMLATNVTIPITGAVGMFRIEAELVESGGGHHEVATGHDQVLAVDWRSNPIKGHGATWENTPRVRDFLKQQKNYVAPDYGDDLGPLDWVVVTRPPREGDPVEIPAEQFDGGLKTTFFSDRFHTAVHQRTDQMLDYFVADGDSPDPQLGVMENYGVRWEGKLVPPVTGDYTFAVESSGGARLVVDGKELFDDLGARNAVDRGRIVLKAGQPVTVRVEFWQRKGSAKCRLLWSPPEVNAPDPAKLIERVRRDGTTLVILDRADTWMPLLTNSTPVHYDGSFKIGTAWLGGLHFVREHPLFKDLPVNCAMDWPYQAVVRNGKARSGLRLEGEELVAGAWHSYPMSLGTAVGIIPCGKGKIIVSTLDISDQLPSSDSSAEVARKLLCNFLDYAAVKH